MPKTLVENQESRKKFKADHPDEKKVAFIQETEYQIVLLIHGIRTHGEWEPMVKEKLNVPGRVIVYPIGYKWFDSLRFWFPFWTRRGPIERVHEEIRVALQKHRKVNPNAKLSIIAHSFGTYIIGEILKKDVTLKLHRLILCGSVLPQDFPWNHLQGQFNSDNTINECGKADIWPVLAQSLSWGYGASGTHGFKRVLIKDRFHAGGHGQYFKSGFVEKFWVPFIRRGEYQGTGFEKVMPPSPWWLSMVGNLPLKWIILLLLTVVIASSCVVAERSMQFFGHPQSGAPDATKVADDSANKKAAAKPHSPPPSDENSTKTEPSKDEESKAGIGYDERKALTTDIIRRLAERLDVGLDTDRRLPDMIRLCVFEAFESRGYPLISRAIQQDGGVGTQLWHDCESFADVLRNAHRCRYVDSAFKIGGVKLMDTNSTIHSIADKYINVYIIEDALRLSTGRPERVGNGLEALPAK